jgi:hypothetical protein
LVGKRRAQYDSEQHVEEKDTAGHGSGWVTRGGVRRLYWWQGRGIGDLRVLLRLQRPIGTPDAAYAPADPTLEVSHAPPYRSRDA